MIKTTALVAAMVAASTSATYAGNMTSPALEEEPLIEVEPAGSLSLGSFGGAGAAIAAIVVVGAVAAALGSSTSDH